MYVPDSLWPAIKRGLLAEHAKIKMGQPDDYESFMTSVIDATSFKKIKAYIEAVRAKTEPSVSLRRVLKFVHFVGIFY